MSIGVMKDSKAKLGHTTKVLRGNTVISIVEKVPGKRDDTHEKEQVCLYMSVGVITLSSVEDLSSR